MIRPPSESEHDAFAKLIESLQQAQDAAKIIAGYRPDQRNQWLQVSEMLEQTRNIVGVFATQGVY